MYVCVCIILYMYMCLYYWSVHINLSSILSHFLSLKILSCNKTVSTCMDFKTIVFSSIMAVK